MKVNVGYFSNINFEREEDKKWEIEEEEMAQSLARSLKIMRKYRGYSLKRVSQETDIPFQTVARYENGENVPSAIQIFKLAYCYKFSVNDMFIIGLFQDIEDYYQEFLEQWERG